MARARTPLRLVSAALLLCLGACDGENGDEGADGMPASICEGEDRVDDFALGLTKTGALYTVSLADADPAEPIRGDNMWMVSITDANGASLDGLTVDARPWMPDHGHGSAVEETVTPLGYGDYQIEPLNLFMAGLWQVTLEITDADGTTDEVMISVCVE